VEMGYGRVGLLKKTDSLLFYHITVFGFFFKNPEKKHIILLMIINRLHIV